MGTSELLIILVIVLIVFGASKLPQLGHGLGSAIKNFRRASNGDDEIEVSKKKELGGRAAQALGDGDEPEDAEVVTRRKSSKKDA